MKRVLPVLLALAFATSAYAQAPGGSAAVPTPANAGEAVPKADPNAVPTSGSNAATEPGAGSATNGSNQATTGSAGTGSGSAATAAKGSQARAWYDVLADKPIEEEGTFWLPKAVNQAADESDMMFYAVLALSAFFFLAIAICVIYFTIKYRHRPGHKPEPSAAHNDVLEITWTVIPTIICVFLFWYGWHSYIRVVTPPNKAVEIDV
ncbi:MAG: cytochrome c oxidase subunit II transmembrane domain-containing protein, partial [Deltaproteobacteria bacterium]